MAIVTGPVYLPAPNPVVRRPGLFDAATGPLELPVHARIGGLQYQTSVCDLTDCYEVECLSGHNTKTFSDGPTTIQGNPFIVLSTVSCSPVGMDDAQLQRYLFDRLVASEQSTVEATFSDQACGQAPGLSNNADVVTVTTGAVDPVAALSALEAQLASVYGLPGIVHAPIALGAYFANLHLVEKQGQVWYTRVGNKVVFGNYSGNDPDGAAPSAGETWMYITGQVAVYRTPDSEIFSTNRMQTLARTTNLVTAVMERDYVVTFDCAVAAAQTEITGVVA